MNETDLARLDVLNEEYRAARERTAALDDDDPRYKSAVEAEEEALRAVSSFRSQTGAANEGLDEDE